MTGLQAQEFKGEVKEPKLEIILTYELADEFLKDEDGNDIPEKPRFFSDRFPFNRLDSEKAKSTLRYVALDPTNKFKGDFGSLINTPCTVTLVVNGEYNNVSNVSAMRAKDADKAPALVNPAIVYDAHNPDPEVYEKLQDWIKTRIKEALDYDANRKAGEISTGEAIDDEIPW
jgi:hypothetical protein